MTPEDYALISTALRSTRPGLISTPEAFSTWQETVRAVRDALSNADPRFDGERFVWACYRQEA